jgi:hypothetical protein
VGGLRTSSIEVTEFSRKHTANVHEGLSEIRRIIEPLVQKQKLCRVNLSIFVVRWSSSWPKCMKL